MNFKKQILLNLYFVLLLDMAKTTVDISEQAHRELLKIQLERKLDGKKGVTISTLASEFLDKGLGIASKTENPSK